MKAGVLALGVGAAVWFWVPLVVKLAGGSDPPGPIANNPQEQVIVTASTSASSTNLSDIARTNPGMSGKEAWPKLLDWMSDDPYTRSAQGIVGHDPFQPLPAPSQQAVPERVSGADAPPVVARPRFTPENLGLELTSTLVGSHRSVAMINGTSYRLTRTAEGITCSPARVKVERGGGVVQVELVAVHPKSVVLEIEGHRHPLKMAELGYDEAGTLTSVSPLQ